VGQLIIIEGNIGAGKTTFAEELNKHIDNSIVMYEPVKENPYLEDFYKDPVKYAFPMQFWLMSQRYQLHLNAVELVWRKGKTVIMDRSIYGDNIFAKALHQQGTFDARDYDNYLKMRETMRRQLLLPHLAIFLMCSPETCLERIAKRGRECEKGITQEYLELLQTHYDELQEDLNDKRVHILQIVNEKKLDFSRVVNELIDVKRSFHGLYQSIEDTTCWHQ